MGYVCSELTCVSVERTNRKSGLLISNLVLFLPQCDHLVSPSVGPSHERELGT